MRLCLLLLASTTLTACGGAGPATVGGTAVSTTTSATTTISTGHTFVNPTEIKTYSAIGGAHSYSYKTSAPTGIQNGQLYQFESTTARNSGITLTYSPRDAIYDIKIAQPSAGVSETIRFQDPAHRTNFGGAIEPQGGVPDLTAQGVNYLQAGTTSGTPIYDPQVSTTFPVGQKDSGSSTATFFFQKPGTTTKYVTFAGFVRNNVSIVQVTPGNNVAPYLEHSYSLNRAVFVFGERTGTGAVPKTGSGTYAGNMIGTTVYNPLLDTDSTAPTYFQWLGGTSTTKVNFAANSFTLDVAGTVTNPLFDVNTSQVFTLQNGATFSASGSGRVDLVTAGGLVGQFQTVFFTQPNGTKLPVIIAGSSIDGAFFGPAAEEVGGGFQIVGGVPDERIVVLGAFTGKQ